MKIEIKGKFIEKWKKYFPGNDLPIVSYYSDILDDVEYPEAPAKKKGLTCIFSQLAPVRMGKPRAFNKENLGCFGAVDMLGFSTVRTEEEMKYNIEFLVNEEKFYAEEQEVRDFFSKYPAVPAKGKYIILKRWDLLSENDHPLVVSFFVNQMLLPDCTLLQIMIQ